jgi:hypothetical protein
VHYQASLAVIVAAWETFVNGIVKGFFAETATPSNYGFHALHTIAREEAVRKLQRFHTPNWENTRELLVFLYRLRSDPRLGLDAARAGDTAGSGVYERDSAGTSQLRAWVLHAIVSMESISFRSSQIDF